MKKHSVRALRRLVLLAPLLFPAMSPANAQGLELRVVHSRGEPFIEFYRLDGDQAQRGTYLCRVRYYYVAMYNGERYEGYSTNLGNNYFDPDVIVSYVGGHFRVQPLDVPRNRYSVTSVSDIDYRCNLQ